MNPDRIEKLHAMGIRVWESRNRPAETGLADEHRDPTGAGTSNDSVRVRLRAGTGDWLIITPPVLPEGSDALVTDIQSLLTAERSRFGQWTDHSQAGATPRDLAGEGIRHVLALAPCPAWPADGVPNLIGPIDLADAVVSSQARRALWHKVRPCLEG